MKAKIFSSQILQKYKKKFDAEINTYYGFSKCHHQFQVRLHGDWKDHIDFVEGGKFAQSLDVSLKSGAIGNFVKFKLLLPKTRYKSNEIIFTHLLRNLGFLAPRTGLVDVEVNGHTSSMIIQEKSEKELLESMGAKEGPLFEGDESYLFQNFKNYNHYDLINIALSRMTNSDWANSSYESAKISFSAFSALQNIYMDFAAKAPENSFALNWELLSNGNEMLLSKWAKYEILLFAAQGSHGLIPHNRKFYFNSFYSAFEPVYYDGAPRSLIGEWIRIIPDFKNYPYLQEEHFDELVDMLNDINQDEFILSMQEENILNKSLATKIFRDISSKILILKNHYLNHQVQSNAQNNPQIIHKQFDPFKAFQKNLKELLPDSFLLSIWEDRNSKELFQTELCSIKSNNCLEKALPFSKLGTLLKKKSLDQDQDQDQDTFFPTAFIVPSSEAKILQNDTYFLDGSIHIQSSPSTKISFDSKNKILDIRLGNFDDWALIIDSNLRGIKVIISSDFFNLTPNALSSKRLNSRGLSGCLSIYNSVFDKTSITASNIGMSCEDSINIVKSSGHISEIKIIGSLSDGLDIDFSSLSIDYLMVNDAGNDCADFSGGKYIMSVLFLSNCGDKGVSIGEQSIISIEDLTIKRSIIGIASKDSSVSSIQSTYFDDVEICLDVYQKKQEFFGSMLSINQLNCDGKRYRKDSNSTLLDYEL